MTFLDLLTPALFALSPEKAHELTISGLKSGLVPDFRLPEDETLKSRVAGIEFPNPLGLAAGFDKNAEVPDAMLRLGFGFAEAGTVTPLPQTGNPRPRIFRLMADRAVINRLGFNNDGHDAVIDRLSQRRNKPGILGINIGANKNSDDFIADYEKGIDAFYDLVSYFTVNISSPNTPGLRNLQLGKSLQQLINRVFERVEANRELLAKDVPVFLKLAPDLTESDLDEIAKVVQASQLSGLVISNTTLDRDKLKSRSYKNEAGGLSGAPLFEKSTIVLAKMRSRLGANLPIVGVGGITSAKDAVIKMEAGANLLQLYTGLVYGGPSLPAKILKGLADHVKEIGLPNVGELVGTNTDEWSRRSI